jgi:hypothetical protein
MFSFRSFIPHLGTHALIEYDVEQSEDELDIKLRKIDGQESSSRGTFAGINHVEVYNLAIRHYFENYTKDEFDN